MLPELKADDSKEANVRRFQRPALASAIFISAIHEQISLPPVPPVCWRSLDEAPSSGQPIECAAESGLAQRRRVMVLPSPQSSNPLHLRKQVLPLIAEILNRIHKIPVLDDGQLFEVLPSVDCPHDAGERCVELPCVVLGPFA